MTDSDTDVTRFCELVNQQLEQGPYDPHVDIDTFIENLTAEHGLSVPDYVVDTARQAIQPQQFFNERSVTADLRFDQCDALLRMSFDPAEFEPKERFIRMVHRLADPGNTFPYVLIGRFWRVSGLQDYDAAGYLARFTVDQLVVTEGIAAAITGHYMSLGPVIRSGEAIGAIGNIVTRERFRGGQGHGTALTEAFERETESIASGREETVRLFILESQVDSQEFWYKLGYRWPLNTKYAQPPLEFDPTTGERLHDEVPETLMVKIPGKANATEVDSELLTAAVRVMYVNWCLAETKQFPTAAARRAEEYVLGKVLGEFRASLPADGSAVPLVRPPMLE